MSRDEVQKNNYNVYRFKSDLNYIRQVLLLCAFLYASFAVLDVQYHTEYVGIIHITRFVMVVPLLLLTYILSYFKFFQSIYQELLLLNYITAGVGIIIMIIVIKEIHFYYCGLYLIYAVGFFMLRLKFRYVVFGTVTLNIIYIVTGAIFIVNDFESYAINLIFFLVFSGIGVYGSYLIDKANIQKYYYEVKILGENIILEKEVYKQYEDLKKYHSASILSMARIAEARDDYTAGHIKRVGQLSKLLTSSLPKEMLLNIQMDEKTFIDSIELASSLHDIGKIQISDLILNKKGSLTHTEFEQIKQHTVFGYNILSEIKQDIVNNSFLQLGVNIARSHHEKWDGTGYPDGLKGNHIPLEARIVALVDVYDALLSERSYKKGYTKEESIQMIRNEKGKHFDPVLTDIFIDIIMNKDTFS